jgi:hypothetical protein
MKIRVEEKKTLREVQVQVEQELILVQELRVLNNPWPEGLRRAQEVLIQEVYAMQEVSVMQ